MKPNVISNVNTSASTAPGNQQTSGHGVTIPINQQYGGQINNQHFQQPDFNTQHDVTGEHLATNYGSIGRSQRPQQPHSQQQQESPLHYQDFDFDSNVGLDMFPRSRLGRMTHDPFGDFGSNSRKRSSLHDPHFHTDGFSRYFDDAADFGFPQFSSLGRRRINPHNDDDFFNRLPSEFRQYIPETFTHRRAGSGMTGNPGTGPTLVETQQPAQPPQSHLYNIMPQSPSRKVCDAAIQTEDPSGRSEVDHERSTETLNQNALRNNMDMGVKSQLEKENQNPTSSSAPPAEVQQNTQQAMHTPSQQIPSNSSDRPTSPTQEHNKFATQTSPHIQSGSYGSQSPQFQKMFYTPQRTHSQQKQQTPPPLTPSGSYIRTIPIFVEGRTEPIINNKEIPNQSSQTDIDDTRAFTPPKQQPRRPTPLNTQQKSTIPSGGLPPQTPHTVDTINKIQNIQRDVLDLMSRVEKFAGTRADKEYVYLDEMLTRNLLKLDNIETNGKDSIRLARKEAIKCIQASINVLEAKAEENKKANKIIMEEGEEEVGDKSVQKLSSAVLATEVQNSAPTEKTTKESKQENPSELVKVPADNENTPISLPPPKSEKFNEVKIEDCPEDDLQATCISDELISKADNKLSDFSKSE